MRYAFEELKVGRLVAATDVPNRASVRVLEKAGLTRVSSAGSQGRESLLHFQLVDDKYVPGDWPYRVAHC